MEAQTDVNDRFELLEHYVKEDLTSLCHRMDVDIKNMPSTIIISASQVVVEPLTKRPGSREIRLNELATHLKQTVDLHDYDIATLKKEVSRHEDEIQQRAHVEFEEKVNEQLGLVKYLKEKLDSQDSVDLVVSGGGGGGGGGGKG